MGSSGGTLRADDDFKKLILPADTKRVLAPAGAAIGAFSQKNDIAPDEY
jgi:hypothetical protein